MKQVVPGADVRGVAADVGPYALKAASVRTIA